jgi:hypothetical protein
MERGSARVELILETAQATHCACRVRRLFTASHTTDLQSMRDTQQRQDSAVQICTVCIPSHSCKHTLLHALGNAVLQIKRRLGDNSAAIASARFLRTSWHVRATVGRRISDGNSPIKHQFNSTLLPTTLHIIAKWVNKLIPTSPTLTTRFPRSR